ncbi:MAG: N-acyl-D-amino-acid deacylase family protein [Candidatus Limnocylindrales bacterium]
MTAFDLLLRGGTLIDGSGAPGRPGDVGILGDRILAIGDLSAVAGEDAATVIDVSGHVVAPGFIDPHGHSDGSLFLDGALVSHLRQGFTTQLSGNCGESLAPITDLGRELVDLTLRANELVARWRTFAEYLDAVAEERLGPNVAFLVGHGTVRGSVIGPEARASTDLERQAMVRAVEAAMDVGAFGLSSGLIYAPGTHAGPDEIAALAIASARRGGLYATHMRNEADGLFVALAEAVATIRAASDAGIDAPRLQVSHLKCASRAVWGRASDAVGVLEAARAGGLDVAADQYPYTAAATTLATVLPPALLGLGVEDCVAALADHEVRSRVKAEMDRGISGWENIARDPGWAGIRISYAPSHPDWAGRSLAELGEALDADPAELAFDALVDDRLDVSVVIDCMDEADVETIMAVPWISVCTDAEGRRPGHPILDAGRPHPRTYGSAARVLGTYVRDRGVLTLEAAVAKLSGVPAARLGLRDRGVLREGAFADVVAFDPTTVADVGTHDDPARHPIGVAHVIVNGLLAVRDGVETGERAGRLLRHAG